jgi:hypothetical protein
MIVCAAGDSHGAIERLYSDIVDFEESLGVRFDYILHVGDFGIWPDAKRIDKATRNHDGASDFPIWFSEKRMMPRKTIIIKGNHEDFVWLDDQPTAEVLPGLLYLRNGHQMDIGVGVQMVTVGGVGGCFGLSDYHRKTASLQEYAKRHYTREDIDQLNAAAEIFPPLTAAQFNRGSTYLQRNDIPEAVRAYPRGIG